MIFTTLVYNQYRCFISIDVNHIIINCLPEYKVGLIAVKYMPGDGRNILLLIDFLKKLFIHLRNCLEWNLVLFGFCSSTESTKV